MRYFIVTLIALFFSACISISNASSSEEIVKKLKQEGEPYFRHLVKTHEFGLLLDRIESGDEVMIRNSYLLSKWADASTSLSLKYALSRALTKKPDAVMSLVPKYFSVRDICTVPYIEAPLEVEFSHISKSISALNRSPKSKTEAVYRQCIDTYKEIKEKISKNSSDP